MAASRARHAPGRLSTLHALLGRLRLRPANVGRLGRRRFRPQLEVLEERSVPTVSILNGGGNGYVGNGGGGPPDVTGSAGPNSYLEVNNSTVTLFNKPNGTILAQHNIFDFFYNAAIGNETLIDQPFSGKLIPIAASPTGATEAGNTVTITTTTPHGFSKGQQVQVSGVGVAGYNGVFTITAVTATTFQYTDATAGLANSGGGTATVDPGSCGVCDSTGVFDNLMGTNGRFIIGEIDIDGTTNVSQYIFAVSKSSNPTTFTTADWNFYHVTTTQTSGGSTSWTDYPGNPGFNADAFVETFNLAKGGGLTGEAEIVSINATDLANGVSQAALHTFQNFSGAGGLPGGTNSYRATTMHDSVAGDPMWLVRNPGDGANLQVVKMTNVLSNAASFAVTTLPLPAANNFVSSGIGNPLNPDSTPMSDVGNRILKAGEYNNTVVAAHAVPVGTASVASATVALDGNGNPIGGTGYTVGDTLTVNGGTGTKATLTVTALGAGGSVSTVNVANPGSYSSLAGINGTVTGGTGTGATFSLIFSGELDVQWYAIDVSSGTPKFQLVGGSPNVGRIGFGANTYSVEPAIDINSSGEIGLGFMESDTKGGAANAATGGFISTFVTARKPTDAAGTMQPVVLVPAGKGTGNINGRIGDFSGMNVDPTPVTVTAPPNQNAAEGASHQFNLGTFTDDEGTFWHVNEFGGVGGPTDIAQFSPSTKGPFTVDVDWGDGTTTSFTQTTIGQIDPGGTHSSHTYGEEKTYTVTVKVTDTGDNKSDSKTFQVAVSDPAVLATGVPVFGKVGLAPTVPTAVFTDPGGAEPNPSDPGAIPNHYTATIDWGDSTPATAGTITYVGAPGSKTGTFTVSGSHAYAQEGTYTVTTTINHEGLITTTTSTAIVTDDIGLLLLDPSANPSLSVDRNSSVTVTGAGAAVVNSNALRAAYLTDRGSVTAADIDVTGGAQTKDRAQFSGPVDHETPTVDPLGLTLPAPSGPVFGAVYYSGNDPLTLQPGTYLGGIHISGAGPVTLAPGVYYLQGGGFSVSDVGSVSGDGVTLISAPDDTTDDWIRITGFASVNLTAPSSGPFRGVVLFQDPNSSLPIRIADQATVTLTGVVYVPDALVRIVDNANVTINPGPGTAVAQPPLLGALIASDLQLDDNAVLTINPDGPSVGNAGFELPNLGVGFNAYRYGDGSGGNPGTLTFADQGGPGWTFSNTAGIAANGSAFGVVGADGNQAGFLQKLSNISQVVSGFANQSYIVRFLAEGRGTQGGSAGSNDLQVSIDGTPLTFGGASSFTPGTGSFTTFTSDPIALTAGTHILTFTGLDTLGGDRTSFIDDVSVFDPPSAASSVVGLAAPSSTDPGSVALAALGVPASGGGGVGVSGDDSSVQAAIVLSRSSSAGGGNPSSSPAGSANTSVGTTPTVGALVSGSSGSTPAVRSGGGKGAKSHSATASSGDPLNEQLVDAVFSSL